MRGTDKNTGKTLSGINHLRQSVGDILMTPLGSRVMRRDYGSRLFELVDALLNGTTLLDIYTATAEALARWEPRFALQNVSLSSAQGGVVTLDLSGVYRPTGQPITLDRIKIK
jgi:phage baseplate assembly protein W